MHESEIAPQEGRGIVVVSGVPGAGKSTVAGLIASALPRAVHIEADQLQKMIVTGARWPHEEPREEGARQLSLRLKNACLLACSFFEERFVPIIDDIVIGSRLGELRDELGDRPLYLVQLLPSLAALQIRNAGRPGRDVYHQARELDAVARNGTEPVGLRFDTSSLTPEETARSILDRLWSEARVQ